VRDGLLVERGGGVLRSLLQWGGRPFSGKEKARGEGPYAASNVQRIATHILPTGRGRKRKEDRLPDLVGRR